MKKVILISGPQGSGKSTLASALSSALNAPVLKFAGPLYDMHEAIRPIAQKYGIPFEKKEGRLLQLLGTDWGRTVKGDSVWVDAAKYAAMSALSTPGKDYVIFDDCRFPNEVGAFGNLALKVRLEAPTEVRKARAEGWREIEHVSETALDGYTGWDRIYNTSEMSTEQCVSWVLDALKERAA